MRLLVDTNAYAELAKGNSHVRLLLQSADEIVMSTVVMGELYAGFKFGWRWSENARQLREFLDTPGVEVTAPDAMIAERYGELIRVLKKKGTPIPANDIWIAATALETASRVVTFDTHFQHVPGLMMAL